MLCYVLQKYYFIVKFYDKKQLCNVVAISYKEKCKPRTFPIISRCINEVIMERLSLQGTIDDYGKYGRPGAV